MENKNQLQTELQDASKNKLTVFLLGFFIGLAVIVPGVSGSAIAIMLGLYSAMLYALGNILSDFKRCVKFLLPLLLGAVIGFGAGFILIKLLFEEYIFEIVCLFVGFMIGAFPAISREIKGEKITPTRAVLFPLGLIIPIAIGIVSIILSLKFGDASDTFHSFPIYRYFAYFPLGAVVSVTQIVPGLSATAILMAFGQFGPILNSVSVGYIFENPEVLGLYLSLGAGFVIGIVLISKLFTLILAKCKASAFFMITGMASGSIICMFINPDMYNEYISWAENGVPVLSIVIGVLLLAAGFACSFILTKIEGKQKL